MKFILVQVFLLFVTITAYASAQVLSCIDLTKPDNGETPSCSKDYKFESECRFTCNDGYVLNGEETLTCVADDDDVVWGVWDHWEPTCQKAVPPLEEEVVEVIAEEPEAAEVIAEEPAVAEVIAEEPADAEVIAEEPAVAEVIAEEPAVAEVIAEEHSVAEVITVPEEPEVAEVGGSFLLGNIIKPSLMCYECNSTISNQHCVMTGKLKRCAQNEGSCQNTVRINNGRLQIHKECKQTEACQTNLRQSNNFLSKALTQNKFGVGMDTQCSLSWKQTLCRCCCTSSKCNSQPLYCISDKEQNQFQSISQQIAAEYKTRKAHETPIYNNEWDAEAAHPCVWNPCGNGGKCLRFPDGKYACKCEPGWRDSHCNTRVSRRFGGFRSQLQMKNSLP